MSQRDVDSANALHHLSNQFLPRDYTYEAFKDKSASHLTYGTRGDSDNDLIIGWNYMFDEQLLIEIPPPAPSPLPPPSSVALQLPAPYPSINFNKDTMCSCASIESTVSEIICNTQIINAATKNSSKRKSIQPKIDVAIKKTKIAKSESSDRRLQR